MNSMLNEKFTARAITIQLLKDTVNEKDCVNNSLTIKNIRNEVNNHQLFKHNIISSLVAVDKELNMLSLFVNS